MHEPKGRAAAEQYLSRNAADATARATPKTTKVGPTGLTSTTKKD
jgi:hypothetical protein